ncbi:MAG: hypothetical protein ACRENJ_11005 [Candidatus Eiseniibacteriota bacterium]
MNGIRGLLIATAAAFIVGCSAGLIGGILLMRFGPPGPPLFLAEGRRGGPMRFERRGPGPREGMLQVMERELDLSPVQHERIIRYIDQARREHAAVQDSLMWRIGRELSPRQNVEWNRWEKVFERTRRGVRFRGPPPPSHP